MGNVIPIQEKKEIKTLDDLIRTKEFSDVLHMQAVGNILKNTEKIVSGKYEGDLSTYTESVKRLNKDTVPEDKNYLMKLNTEQRADEIRNYIKNKRKDVEPSFKSIEDKLYDVYTANIQNSIDEGVKKVKEQANIKNNEALPEELKAEIYKFIGHILAEANLSAQGNSKLANYYTSLKTLMENPKQAEESANVAVAGERNLIYGEYLNVNPAVVYDLKAQEIANELVKEENGRLIFDVNKFKETFMNYDSGLSIANYLMVKKAQMLKALEMRANRGGK